MKKKKSNWKGEWKAKNGKNNNINYEKSCTNCNRGNKSNWNERKKKIKKKWKKFVLKFCSFVICCKAGLITFAEWFDLIVSEFNVSFIK